MQWYTCLTSKTWAVPGTSIFSITFEIFQETKLNNDFKSIKMILKRKKMPSQVIKLSLITSVTLMLFHCVLEWVNLSSILQYNTLIYHYSVAAAITYCKPKIKDHNRKLQITLYHLVRGYIHIIIIIIIITLLWG